MSKYSFSQKERIKQDTHFQYLLNKGDKFVSDSFILYKANKKNENQNIGLIASKTIGNAVYRNKAKRKLKEMVRQQQYHIHKQFDILLIARQSLLTTSYQALSHEFINSLQESSTWID